MSRPESHAVAPRASGWVRLPVLAGALAILAGASASLGAQDNYEIQVYGSELVPRGKTMVELHSNFTLSGSRVGGPGSPATNHAAHETLEITHGFSEWFETGFYLFNSFRGGDGYQWVGTHIRPRFAVPARFHWPVGVSLSQEIGYQRRAFSEDTWTWEIRPIVDQQIGRFYWSLNPTLERALRGPGTQQGVEFAPNAQVNVDVTPKVNVALEYYGTFGPLRGFDPIAQTEQQIFPAVNLNLGPEWEFNFGVGAGLTSRTDHLLVKMILGRRLGGK